MEEDPSVFDYDGVYDKMKGKIARPKVQDRTERNIEEQHKKAMEEDPSVFDYDEVYDEMKGKITRPKVQDRTERKKTSKPTPPRPPPHAFAFDGSDDEDDIERKISRHASKNKSLRKIEEQHKQAMEEDPSVFDYDRVYNEMKGKIARPKVQDRTERKKTSKPAPPRPRPAFAFGDGDDEDDIEREISRQASKNKSPPRRFLKMIEEQHKKAMEEDPSVFEYDGVYDKMKGKITRPMVQDRTERMFEEQHKKAMEDDPSVFDYDGVSDEIKGKIARPKVLD
ncbi:uncharacterized protein LOC135644292 [Musa acuminata AAA Group]|uniref:uncharacterized protein LOC135644292 n=1 Tax=Musa acuminata AAA Group TaxID=214697 RepID=UPI0031DE32A4